MTPETPSEATLSTKKEWWANLSFILAIANFFIIGVLPLADKFDIKILHVVAIIILLGIPVLGIGAGVIALIRITRANEDNRILEGKASAIIGIIGNVLFLAFWIYGLFFFKLPYP